MLNHSLPDFSKIDINNFTAKLDEMLQKHLQEIDDILNNIKHPTWDNLIYPLDKMSNELEQFWSPFSHLHAVLNSPKLREVYQACLPKLSKYESAIGHNKKLYNAITQIDVARLNSAQAKIIQDSIRDFELSGVALSDTDKKRFEEISVDLATASNKFENNILDAVQDYQLHIADESKMRGLPEHILASAKALAIKQNLSGYVLNLEQPTFVGVITYADDRDLREKIYEAYLTRASEIGPSAGKFDNTYLMDEILELRSQHAKLLGFSNYAELSLATKMADSPADVNKFLSDLVNIAYPKAKDEFAQLEQFGLEKYQIAKVAPWDVAYLSEKRQHLMFEIYQEELRPYFPVDVVMPGLFATIKKLYDMTFERVANTDIWHPDVECYSILDKEKHIRGYIYIDLFARENKRSGAWMDSCRSRFRHADGLVELPIATLTCNFAKSAEGKIATLSHSEVETLFHECGHCLQHVLTKVDYLGGSGINGVEWDAVELPSQFFENWCWDKEALKLLTKHIETGKSIERELFQKLVASKNFQSAMALVRQLEFAIFDFEIHEKYMQGVENFIANTLTDVRKRVSVLPIAAYNRFQNSFSHIFAGGYAAGYYSYKWAEVLSCDAFSRFEREGIFSKQAGGDFLKCILEVGGSVKASQAFYNYMGREAKIDALLRHCGIGGA
ncbi:MAG: oligopeptidase A [Legionellales bacterium RIFCSPHIGHO2_12_FULL_35_11]|nr:MAG: oligopeptidase A [Legionellales bacterium RIFCSPHIGHO2_12_FULL_35_11]